MTKIFYFPLYKTNEYTELLYSEAAAFGVELIVWNRHLPLQSGDIFHLHWEDAVIKHSDNPMLSANIFVERLEKMKQIGVRIIWTVHNVASHLSVDNTAEFLIRDWLKVNADTIVLHSLNHIGILGFEDIGHKVRITPLPVYIHEPLYKPLKEVCSIGTAGHARSNKNLSALIDLLDLVQKKTGITGIIHAAGYKPEAPLPNSLELYNEYLTQDAFHQLLERMDTAIILSADNLNSSALTNFLGRNIPCFVPSTLFDNTDLPEEYRAWILPSDSSAAVDHIDKCIHEIEHVNNLKKHIYNWSLARTPKKVSTAFFQEVIFG